MNIWGHPSALRSVTERSACQEWPEDGSAWERSPIATAECARIPRDWLEHERATIGDYWYRQECGCELLDTPTPPPRSNFSKTPSPFRV